MSCTSVRIVMPLHTLSTLVREGFKSAQSKCGILLASWHNKELLGSSSVVVRYPVEEVHSWMCSQQSDKHTSAPRISPSTSLDLTHQRRILQHHLRTAENVCLILCFSKYANSSQQSCLGMCFSFRRKRQKGRINDQAEKRLAPCRGRKRRV